MTVPFTFHREERETIGEMKIRINLDNNASSKPTKLCKFRVR